MIGPVEAGSFILTERAALQIRNLLDRQRVAVTKAAGRLHPETNEALVELDRLYRSRIAISDLRPSSFPPNTIDHREDVPTLTPEEVADRTGLSGRRVRQILIDRPGLGSRPDGLHWRVPEDQLHHFQRTRRERPRT